MSTFSILKIIFNSP